MACMQVAHKFNVRSALHYCDTFLSSKADEDPQFFNLGVGLLAYNLPCPRQRGSACKYSAMLLAAECVHPRRGFFQRTNKPV